MITSIDFDLTTPLLFLLVREELIVVSRAVDSPPSVPHLQSQSEHFDSFRFQWYPIRKRLVFDDDNEVARKRKVDRPIDVFEFESQSADEDSKG